jgi:PhnB protein
MPTSTVKPIPDGMHTITPHLVCKGAADAIAFYIKAFNAVERTRLPGPGGTVMHAMLGIGDSTVMLGEEFENCGSYSPLTLKGSPVTLHLYVNDVDAAFAQAVEAGAKVIMPVTDMFWGDRYGQVEDPFGHRWSLATHTRDLSPEQIREGMAAMPQR